MCCLVEKTFFFTQQGVALLLLPGFPSGRLGSSNRGGESLLSTDIQQKQQTVVKFESTTRKQAAQAGRQQQKNQKDVQIFTRAVYVRFAPDVSDMFSFAVETVGSRVVTCEHSEGWSGRLFAPCTQTASDRCLTLAAH